MPSEQRVHPTAIIGPEVALAEDVVIEPFAVLEGQIRLGSGCRVGPGVQLIGPLVMGQNNEVGARSVIGERPQHLGYTAEPTGVTVGDDNRFAGRVTVHGGTRSG